MTLHALPAPPRRSVSPPATPLSDRPPRVCTWPAAAQLELMELMDARGFAPNPVVYGAAIDACGRAGQWARSLRLLEEMRTRGIEPNRVCYNAAISACDKAQRADEALTLFQQAGRPQRARARRMRLVPLLSSSCSSLLPPSLSLRLSLSLSRRLPVRSRPVPARPVSSLSRALTHAGCRPDPRAPDGAGRPRAQRRLILECDGRVQPRAVALAALAAAAGPNARDARAAERLHLRRGGDGVRERRTVGGRARAVARHAARPRAAQRFRLLRDHFRVRRAGPVARRALAAARHAAPGRPTRPAVPQRGDRGVRARARAAVALAAVARGPWTRRNGTKLRGRALGVCQAWQVVRGARAARPDGARRRAAQPRLLHGVPRRVPRGGAGAAGARAVGRPQGARAARRRRLDPDCARGVRGGRRVARGARADREAHQGLAT
eukprot:6323036-Prymnesium_polylepis.1